MGNQLVSVDAHLSADWAHGAMRTDIARAFSTTPRVLPPKWLYNERGSELFEQITRLPAYYPTEAERTLLQTHANEIAKVTRASTVVELGSGTSDKTTTLLDAFAKTGQLKKFVPLDVSQATLLTAAENLSERYDGLAVHAVVGDFTRHLGELERSGDRMVAFLGGTLGNLYVEERRAFLGSLADALDHGEWLLLGVDLIKPVEQILNAYDDDGGVTAAFISNVLLVLNDSLGANFDPACFDYVPLWDPQQSRVDMRLRVDVPHRARIDELDLDISFAEGEEIRVEISTKFDLDQLNDELSEVDLRLSNHWVSNERFALLLARRQ